MLCRDCVLCAHCGISRIAARLSVTVAAKGDAAGERRLVHVYVCGECCEQYEKEKAKLAVGALANEELSADESTQPVDGSDGVASESDEDETDNPFVKELDFDLADSEDYDFGLDESTEETDVPLDTETYVEDGDFDDDDDDSDNDDDDDVSDEIEETEDYNLKS